MAEITLDEAKKEAASLRTQLNEWLTPTILKMRRKLKIMFMIKATIVCWNLKNFIHRSLRLIRLRKEWVERSIVILPRSITRFRCYRWGMFFF